ncbi:MAG: sulfate reduction electron transfer complex DsrMKJOP subunit DsrM [candidate division Zixibacteria bacterium]|nr:sulfate reduction electron transfer complex DsrMKJOP subunit DsrM [candidate division Zixibacteria bacterium]
MNIVLSLLAVIILLLLAFIGVDVAGWRYFFGVIMPMATIIVFILGMVYRVIKWARSPVPFRITTTCGQQKSLPWFKASNLENPYNIWGVLGRMFLEIFFFRSLFRNTKVGLKDGPRLVYGSTKWLWLGGLVFHWSFLIVFIRHFKFFAEPVPAWVLALQNLDGFFQIGLPIIYATDIALLAALTFLFLRRVADPKLRYISLAADYFPLFLLMGIAVTGVLMRYFTKVDIIGIKEMAMGWLSLSPTVPEGISSLFFMHLFLVCCLFIYFPFSKLLHMAGIFVSPTRNLANTNRIKRHVNPWDYPVKLHTYEEYEDEFREVMKAAEMPLEKE